MHGLLSARQAAKRFGLSHPELIEAAKEKRIGCASMVERGRYIYVHFDERDLAAELKRLACREDGCDTPTLGGSSGYCVVHVLQALAEERRLAKASERDWLTQEEACAYKRCSVGAVQRARRDGELHAERHGGELRIPRAELDGWTPRPRGGQRVLEPRECAYRECNVVFQPRHAGREYHSRPCMWAEREARERDRIDEAKATFGFLETDEMAAAIHRSTREVNYLSSSGRLCAVRWIGGGGPCVLLFPQSEVERFDRDCARRAKADGRQMSWLEPKTHAGRRYLVARVMERTGLSELQARAVLREEAKTRRAILRFNAGAPKKESPAHFFEWHAMFYALGPEAAQRCEHGKCGRWAEVRVTLDGFVGRYCTGHGRAYEGAVERTWSERQAEIEVARRVRQSSPDQMPHDPEVEPDRAADVIRYGVSEAAKALQKGREIIPAA